MNGKTRAAKPDESLPKDEEAQSALPMDEIFSGTAIFSNKVFVTVIPPAGIRLTFMEAHKEGEERFRAAVYLSILDAISLRDVLSRQLEKIEVVVEQAEGGVA